MKKLALLTFLIISNLTVWAQHSIQATLMVNPPYTNLFSDYLNDRKVNLMLSGNGTVRIAGYLKSNTGVSLQLPESFEYYKTRGGIYPIAVTGQRKVSTHDLQEAFAIGIVVNNSTQNLKVDAIGNLILPEGDYELCVKVFEANGYQQLSEQVCAYFTIANFEAPFLQAPQDKDSIPNATATYQPIQFQWTYPAGAMPNRITYVLQIAELLPNQNPYNVFESGPPFAEMTINNGSPVYVLKPTDPKFEVGKHYAWRVKVKEKEPVSKYYNFQNNGLSQVWTFQYGAGPKTATGAAIAATTPAKEKPDKTPDLVGGQCACKFPVVADKTPVTTLDNSQTVFIGGKTGYQLSISTLAKTDTSYTGEGTVALSPDFKPTARTGVFIPLKVTFKDLQVNKDGVLLAGQVQSKKSADNLIGLLPSAANSPGLPDPDELMRAVGNWKPIQDKIAREANQQRNGAGFETPFGFSSEVFTVAVDNVLFTATSAQYDAMTVIEDVSGLSKISIPLGVKGACLPMDGCQGSNVLYLLKNVPIPHLGITLKGGTDVTNATHFIYNPNVQKGEGNELSIVAEYVIPGASLVAGGDSVKVILRTTTKKGFDNWMATATVSGEFKMKGIDDFTFKLTNATYDHDLNRNPDGFVDMLEGLTKDGVPVAKLANLQKDVWQGFYMNELSVTLPGVFQTEKGGKTAVQVKNMLIDGNLGLSGSLGAGSVEKPVIKYEDGSLDGWYFSLENIGITFFDGAFVKAGASGKVGLPISGTDKKSALAYTTTLSPNESTGALKYNFNVVPTDKINASVWAATMTVNPDSRLDITLGDQTVNNGKLTVKAKLNGSLSFAATDVFKLEVLKINNLVIQSMSPYVVVDATTSETIKQASGDSQRFFSGAFTSSKQADIDKKTSGNGSKPATTNESGQASAGGFPFVIEEFKPVVDSRDGKNIRAGFYFFGGLQMTDIALAPKALVGLRVLASIQFNSKRPVWKGVDPELDKVVVAGQLGPVKIKGGLELYRGNETFGTGFKGDLKAEIASVGVDVTAQFGNKKFNYWYVHAGVSGLTIPVGPTVTITGFLGGAYHNMTMTTEPTGSAMANLPTVAVKSSEQSENRPLFTPTPTGDGLRAGIRVAIIEKNILKGQAIGTVQWGDGGLQIANLKGDAQLINSDGDADTKGMVNGTAELNYDFRTNVFWAKGEMTADQAVFSLKSKLDVLVDTQLDKYHIFVGTPDDRTTLKVAGIFEAQSYFMIGNDIPDIPKPVGIPDNILYGKLNYKPSKIGGFGTGIGFGANINMHYETSILGITPHVSLAAGLDVSLRKVSNAAPCPGGTVPGYKGWYAQGNVYAYIDGGVDFWGLTSFDVALGALLQAGLPNPTWVNGSAFIAFSVFGLDYDASIQIELGKQCKIQSAGNVFDKPLIASIDMADGEQGVSLFKQPVITLNYPTKFQIPDDFDPNKLVNYTINVRAEFTDGSTTTVFRTTDGTSLKRNEYPLEKLDERRLKTWGSNLLSMKANTDYALTVTAETRKTEVIQPQQSTGITVIRGSAASIKDSKALRFRTEAKLSKLDELVELQYPYTDQKYVLPGEVKTGQINMNRVVNFTDYNDSRFTYDPMPWVQLIDEKTGIILEAKTKQTDTRFSYPMPTLAKNTTYSCRFVLKGKGKPLTFATGYVDPNVKSTSAPVVTKTVTAKTAASAPAAEPDLVDVATTLYSYRFRTSQHQTFTEKMAGLRQGGSSVGTGLYSADLIFNPEAETFDRPELFPRDYQNAQITISAQPVGSRFFKEKVQLYERKLASDNGYWAGDPLFNEGFSSRYSALATGYDLAELSDGPATKPDKRGLTVRYSYKAVKDYFDAVSNYMRTNYPTALSRYRAGDRAVTLATLETMEYFILATNPPTPFDQDKASVVVEYNPDPLNDYKPTKRSVVDFSVEAARVNTAIKGSPHIKFN